jgi:hypothetical protein
MQCAICNDEIGLASAVYFGPEFAHNSCIIAFKHGQDDGRETEREACASICDTSASVFRRMKGNNEPVAVTTGDEECEELAYNCELNARFIRERSNVK